MLVVKIGGATGIATPNITADIATYSEKDSQLVVVHGGSGLATDLGEQLGYPPRFVTSISGHTSRYTDRRTLEIFLMATALLNRRLVAELQQLGVNAAGISGLDGQLIQAQRKATLRIVANGKRKVLRDDYTGQIQAVNDAPLRALLDSGLTPVIAPVAISEAGEPLNVDGDRVAAHLAATLQATRLIILSNVPGLLHDINDEASLISHLEAHELENAIDTYAHGSMKRKLIGVREAIRGGVLQVILADGRTANPIAQALQGQGTVIDA